MNYETEQVSAQYINSNFVRKIEEGRIKEAEAAGTTFIRKKMREDSFARRILTPVTLTEDEIDRDLNLKLINSEAFGSGMVQNHYKIVYH